MSNQKAIKLLKNYIANYGRGLESQPIEDCKVALGLLEAEPEPGEFTKRMRRIFTTKTAHSKAILEACDKIDHFKAELRFTKQELGAANLEIKTLKNKLTYVRKRYPEIDEMEQALKGTKCTDEKE